MESETAVLTIANPGTTGLQGGKAAEPRASRTGGVGSSGTTTLGNAPEPLHSFEVTIVLATLNEKENLPSLVEKIRQEFLGSAEIIVVDDGSIDGTQEFVNEISKTNSWIRGVFNDGPGSIARAHIQGIEQARGKYVIMMDADHQHPPSMLPVILQSLRSGNDVVVASRYCRGGDAGTRDPIRGVISRVACVLARLSVSNARGLTDPISGYFGVRRTLVPHFRQRPRGFESLLFILACIDSPKLVELPYGFRERGSGESKVVRGLTFVRVYLASLVLAKRLERMARRQAAERSTSPYVMNHSTQEASRIA